jgi:HlyD family secretion protein
MVTAPKTNPLLETTTTLAAAKSTTKRVRSRSAHGLRAVAIAAVAVLVTGGAVVAVVTRSTKQAPVAFETSVVERGPISAKVTATGTLSALVTVQVGSQVSGRVQKLLADFNSPVKKGQLLATLDPQLYEAALEQAKANTLAADSNLARAKAESQNDAKNLVRSKALFERQLIAQAELDAAQTAADVAEAGVGAAQSSLAQAKAALHQAEVNLAYTTIYSPIDGIVISRNVDVGQTVAAAFQSPTLFVLAEDLKKMQVDTSVSEADVGKLSAGMHASFLVDAYPKETFAGVVRQIRNAPQTVQNVVTYDAVIDVENDALKLRPGMTANVTFVVDSRADVVRVPNQALRVTLDPALLAQLHASPAVGDKDADRRNLWLLKNGASGAPSSVAVVTGISDGRFTEIVSGDVKAGDVVVTDAPAAPKAGLHIL